MKKERRNLTSAPRIETREDGGKARIEGYALVFDTESLDLGGFRERIAPGALDGVLEKSDILALYNHDSSRGVLARSRRGEGSLELTVDEKGLRYAFEVPATALGDEVAEGIRRGDIAGSSFAFTVAEDQWEKETDGRYLRTIVRFNELYDVSPVIHPAYEATSVDTRGLVALKEEEERAARKDDKEEPDDKEDPQDDDEEEKKEDEPSDEKEEEGNDEKEEENKRNNVTPKITMKKKRYSLLGAIRALSQNRPFDEASVEMTRRGRAELDRNGITDATGQLVIPLGGDELRYEETPNGIIASQNEEALTYGGEAVPTDTFDVLGPLKERLVLAGLGARVLNLTGNVEIPVYSGANCTWESEIGKAKNGAGKFEKVRLSPKRLTAKLPISKQWLNQTSPDAEAVVREDLLNCIAEKLQATILGNGAGSDTEPAGLFKGVSAESAALTYEDVVGMEEALELAKIYGEKAYVLSPSAKAILRTTKVDAGSGRFVMEDGEVLGTKAECTGSVVSKGMILGDWRQLYIGAFGALDLTVDPFTLADSAQIQLVVNAWFDFAVVRKEAFVKKILK